MNFQDYMIAGRSNKKYKPNADIEDRWKDRVKPHGWQEQGEAGAEAYLEQHGKTIGAPKCIMLARYAEEQGYPKMALGFWKKAFRIEHPQEPVDAPEPITDAPAVGTPVVTTPRAKDMPLITAFPDDMQPGHLVTMQPTDAQHDREYYIQHPSYWSAPKRDGNKIIVFATPDMVWYQSRQRKVNGAPSGSIDAAFRVVAQEIGAFIVEGEVFYLDASGKEHMTGATAQASNVLLGKPDHEPLQKIMLFGCLWSGLTDLRLKRDQIQLAEQITLLLVNQHTRAFTGMYVARTVTEKEELARSQRANGKEGEVYFLHDLQHRPDKITSSKDPQYDGYVRCKYYLGVQRYRITAVAPTKAAGHFIGGFSIEDTDGKPVGTVGTGYTREQQKEILERYTANPNDTWVLVDAQTVTIYGQLRHAAFKGFVDDLA